MVKQKKIVHDFVSLRQQAEKLVNKKSLEEVSQLSDIDTLKLLHELEVHQIELEMQNEELKAAKLNAEVISQKYLELYDFAPSGYFTLSTEGNIMELNLSGSQILGKTRSGLKNKSFGVFVSDDTKPIFHLFLRRIFSNNTQETCEITLISKDNPPRYVYLTGIAVGSGDQCVVNVVEISTLKLAQEAIKKNEERYHAIILQTAMDGFWLVDLQGRLQQVNETYCKMSGYNVQELMSMHISDLEAIETVESISARIQKILLRGEDRFETRHRCKDGRIIDVEISIQYQPQGEWFVAFIHDITERKMAERYREMAREILQILNEPGEIADLIKEVLTTLKNGTGFDAVGIRLQDGEDFPYIAQKGFSRDFLLTENSLINRARDGGVCRDSNCNARLECTCGMVISGKADLQNKLLTKGGSWYTNDSFQLLDIQPGEDARIHPRNLCIHQGYASVALVPIRDNERNIGLLQFNDRLKDRFNRISIEKLEGIASHIGAAIMRKHAEETLKESEIRRLAILETAMDGFWLLNMDGCLLEVNETYCRMTGYSAKELRSMHVHDLDVVVAEVDTIAQLQKVIALGDDRFESRHRRKDGSTFDVEVSVQYQSAEGGQFVTFLHDITDRKIAEENLRQSEERYKSLFQNNHSVMLLIDPDTGQIKDANPAATHFYGWSHSEMCKKYISEINTSSKEEVEADMKLAKKQVANQFFFKHRLANGEEKNVEIFSGPIKFGELTMLYSIIHDITKRKQAEDLLREKDELLNKAQEIGHLGSWSLDLIKNQLTWSDEIYRIFGLKPNEFSATYEAFLDAVHPEDRDLVNSAYTNSILEGKDSYEIEHRIIRKYSGEPRYVYEKCEHLRDASGKIVRSVGMVHDITERKQSENALRESEERIKFKLQSILSPEGTIADLELNDIIDAPAIQKLMDNFYELTQIPIAIIDISGKVLVGVGWQDICTKFHRAHPGSCRNCIISDIQLTKGIPDGEFKIYKCKNNMWDMATPLIIGGEHKGNLFMGQFFFDSEPVEYKLFREQAYKYGFAEQEYMDALDNAPRINQQKLDHAKAFFLNLSRSISQLSYGNIKLARAITQQKIVEDALRESERLLRESQSVAHIGSYSADLINQTWIASSEIYEIFGIDNTYPHTIDSWVGSIHPDFREELINDLFHSTAANKRFEHEYKIIRINNGMERWIHGVGEIEYDNNGNRVRLIGTVQDITKRKQSEETLKHLYEELEDRVKERTAELLKVNTDLQSTKEKYRTVADFTYDWEYWINPEGSFDYVSPSCERISGFTAEEFINDPKLLSRIIFYADAEIWENHENDAHIFTPDKLSSEFNVRIVTKTGDLRWICCVCQKIFVDGKYLGIRASNRDITDKINAENELLNVTLEVEERERNHFSRELHDGLGPLLSTVKLYFQWLAETNDAEKTKLISEKGNHYIESAIQTTHEMALGLSSLILVQTGYVKTILNFIHTIIETQKLSIDFTYNSNIRFDYMVETTLYRITTELINNTVKYAMASKVKIAFNYQKELYLISFSYADDGIGFDLVETERNGTGLGLLNIRQRINLLKGMMRIETSPGKGVEIYIELPVNEQGMETEAKNQLAFDHE